MCLDKMGDCNDRIVQYTNENGEFSCNLVTLSQIIENECDGREDCNMYGVGLGEGEPNCCPSILRK